MSTASAEAVWKQVADNVAAMRDPASGVTLSTALSADAEPVYDCVNRAYAVEVGDTGVAFKTGNRCV
jgi:hypothetical protein